MSFKFLYLHGLDSKPNPEKIGFVENQFGLEAVAPKLDYYKHFDTTHIYDFLAETIDRKRIRMIIGSSMGGYFGFYLSEAKNIPAFLLNPALTIRSIQIPVRKPIFSNSRKFVLLGERDDVIPHKDTIEFLESNGYTETNFVIKSIGHAVTGEEFAEFMRETYDPSIFSGDRFFSDRKKI